MAIVTGDRYVELLVKFVEKQAGSLLDGTLILKLNPVGLHYVQSRLEALQELERLRQGAPVDYLRAYIADLGDYRALEQLRRVFRLLTSLKVFSVLPHPTRDPTPLSLLPFGRLRCLELRGCDLSTSAARGLLELRHTLEKIICHNSADALRHVFAGRIVEIQDCPVWTRLSFVSCAGNGMLLMDESLQLIPAVETLDLSRNRFGKIANLHKCAKLKHLDLGFNHIRTIPSLNEVACGIRKLILRNNALTTLRGIENLISLEGLDLSYNTISSFTEIESLASLSSLGSLWLEGNPICYAKLYRQQVFSFFCNPEKLKLDEKLISRREAWAVKVIVARRQKQRVGHGFYAPAKDEIQSEVNTELGNSGQPCEANSSADVQPKARRKIPRLAWIEDPENKRCLVSEGLEQDGSCSPSCESESQRRDELDAVDGDKTDALDLMNRIETSKKENSVAWFLELRKLFDNDGKDTGDYAQDINYNSSNGLGRMRDKRRQNRLEDSPKARLDGEEGSIGHRDTGTRYGILQQLGHDNVLQSTDDLQENSSLGKFSSGAISRSEFLANRISSVEPRYNPESKGMQIPDEQLKPFTYGEARHLPKVNGTSSFVPDSFADEEMIAASLKAIDEVIESRSSSVCHGSPPHYQEDILQRRQNLEEEFMQLSLDSYSIASSIDSDTSDDIYCSSDSSRFVDSQSISHVNADGDFAGVESDMTLEDFNEESNASQQSSSVKHSSLGACGRPDLNETETSETDHAIPSCTDDILADAGGGKLSEIACQGVLSEPKLTRKPKKRVVLFDKEEFSVTKPEETQDISTALSASCNRLKQGTTQIPSAEDGFDKSWSNEGSIKTLFNGVEYTCPNSAESLDCNNKKLEASVHVNSEDPIKLYFRQRVADVQASEICLQYVSCNCIRLWEDKPEEREVLVLLSSESKLYILLTSPEQFQPGVVLKVLGSHMLRDIRDVIAGMGLQALKVHIGHAASYLFLTRNIDKSRVLLSMLENCVQRGAGESSVSLLQSWEQLQINLFEKDILGGFRMSIILYAMVLFSQGNQQDSAWVARSIFLTADYIFLCLEDLMQFGSVSEDSLTAKPYFSLEACASIKSILELLIEQLQGGSVTLIFSHVMSGRICCATNKGGVSSKDDRKAVNDNLDNLVWRLKGFAGDALLKFVTLLQAIYMRSTTRSLPVKKIM